MVISYNNVKEPNNLLSCREVYFMDLAKITSKDQITIVNPSMDALIEAQNAFHDEAQNADIKNDNDIINLIREIRQERAVK